MAKSVMSRRWRRR